jgi:Mn2+/Fe2+ NRAMP family transporter
MKINRYEKIVLLKLSSIRWGLFFFMYSALGILCAYLDIEPLDKILICLTLVFGIIAIIQEFRSDMLMIK